MICQYQQITYQSKTSYYKDNEIEIEKIVTLELSVIVGDVDIIEKETGEHINKIVPAYMKYKKKLHFAELFIFLGEYNQCDWKNFT